ncbi:MAG TPA: Uma2 family endonuclease [Promineifilum sp.]
MVAEIVRFRFTADEYEQMIAARILTEEDRVELIDGEIIEMSPLNVRHAACVKRLNALFSVRLADRAIISVQDPIRIDVNSQPQPDIALLHRRSDFYEKGHPEPEDIILIVEVAESSAQYDRDVKASLYARAGIAEYWLADLTEGRVEVRLDPEDGQYRTLQVLGKRDTISPVAFPEVLPAIDAFLA